MKRLLSNKGSIYVHIDWRMVHYLRVVLDEVFGANNFLNHIVWKRQTSSGFKGKNSIGKNYDDLLLYTKSPSFVYNTEYIPYLKEYIEKRFSHIEEEIGKRFKDEKTGTATTAATIERLKSENKIYYTNSGKMRIKIYLDEALGREHPTFTVSKNA